MLETLLKTCPPDNGKMDGTWSQSAGNAISWLAGFVDGEGSIGFDKISSKKNCHVPHVTLTNCHKPTIERVSNILLGLGIRCWVVSPKSRRNPKWKQDWIVVVRGLRRTKPLLEFLIPHLFTKRQQAESVLEFIKERLSKSQKAPYGDKEIGIIQLLHDLNRRGSSETTRATLDTEKI
jgi:hypothetical protein